MAGKQYQAAAEKYERLAQQTMLAKQKLQQLVKPLLESLLETNSLRQVARGVRRSPTYVSQIRQGHSEVSPETFRLLASFYSSRRK